MHKYASKNYISMYSKRGLVFSMVVMCIMLTVSSSINDSIKGLRITSAPYFRIIGDVAIERSWMALNCDRN